MWVSWIRLVVRTKEGAIITDEKEAIKRVKMIKENKVKAITGKDIPIKIVPLYKIV